MSSVQRSLTSVPLFEKLPPASLRRLEALASVREFPAETEIVKEGDAGVGFFLIVDGTAEAVHGATVLRALRPGDYFGEMALLDGERRSATVRAKTPVRCIVLTRWDFLAEVRSNPDLAVGLLETLSRRLRTAEAAREVDRTLD